VPCGVLGWHLQTSQKCFRKIICQVGVTARVNNFYWLAFYCHGTLIQNSYCKKKGSSFVNIVPGVLRNKELKILVSRLQVQFL